MLGTEPDCDFSPAMIRKVVHAGVSAHCFRQAASDLGILAESEVSEQRVRRLTERIGDERVAQQEAAAAAYEQLPLVERDGSPMDQFSQVVCVQIDGGRIQIRDRLAPQPEVVKGEKGRFWRETKAGCLLTMQSVEHPTDPCPTIPRTFVDPSRMEEISREIKGFSASVAVDETEPVEAVDERPHRPLPLVKSVVATREDIHAFGRRLVAAAYQRGFSAAPRKAFVADGAAANWTVWRKHFSAYTPILDFTHAICYIYAAAMTGCSAREGWNVYCRWAQWVWSGRVDLVIEALQERQAQLGPPLDDDPATTPRSIVADGLRYLTNQQSRMNYADYRRLGLPITSSYIESTIKQINRRLKGSEKFWSQGAEPLLQLTADHLSETTEFDRFWKGRPKTLAGTRRYQTAL